MQALSGVSYALCVTIVWLAFAHRRALALPRWLMEAGDVKSPRRELFLAAGVFVFLLLLDGLPDLYEQFTGRDAPAMLGPGFVYVVFLFGGWAAGRWGGRFGIATALAYLLFRVLIPVVSIPVGLFFIEEANKTQIFVHRVVEEWIPLLLITPYALVYTLMAAMWGAWTVYGKAKTMPDPSGPVQGSAELSRE